MDCCSRNRRGRPGDKGPFRLQGAWLEPAALEDRMAQAPRICMLCVRDPGADAGTDVAGLDSAGAPLIAKATQSVSEAPHVVLGQHPPIMTRTLWDALGEVPDGRGRKGRPVSRRSTLPGSRQKNSTEFCRRLRTMAGYVPGAESRRPEARRRDRSPADIGTDWSVDRPSSEGQDEPVD